MPYRVRRWTPRLDCLDGRVLPSVTITETDGVLVVRGDQYSNIIEITDDGTADAGAVVVDADGEIYESVGLITKVRVIGWNGADSVNYSLTGDLVTDRTLAVFLGNQDDTFEANLNGWDIDAANLLVLVYGGNGQDSLAFHGLGTDVGADSSLTVRLLGGNGMDSLRVDYSGVLIGDATFRTFGGNGKDTVTANLTLPEPGTSETGETTETSTGTLTARFCGGNGVDDLTVTVAGIAENDLSSFDVLVHGGHGKDNFTTSGVTAVDAPKSTT